MTAVREPIDRFLSGYVDKCIRKVMNVVVIIAKRSRSPTRINFCNNCWANMTCFILAEYDRLMKQASNGSRLPNTFEDRHFGPQNW